MQGSGKEAKHLSTLTEVESINVRWSPLLMKPEGASLLPTADVLPFI